MGGVLSTEKLHHVDSAECLDRKLISARTLYATMHHKVVDGNLRQTYVGFCEERLTTSTAVDGPLYDRKFTCAVIADAIQRHEVRDTLIELDVPIEEHDFLAEVLDPQ